MGDQYFEINRPLQARTVVLLAGGGMTHRAAEAYGREALRMLSESDRVLYKAAVVNFTDVMGKPQRLPVFVD